MKKGILLYYAKILNRRILTYEDVKCAFLATNITESVGSLFGSNKVKTLERENAVLHREVVDHEETIEALQDKIQPMQTDYNRQLLDTEVPKGD